MNSLEIKSNKCVNSNWPARFMAKGTEEYCQCSFGECKIKVLIAHNGHKPYEYILTEKEIEEAKKTLK
jgi:glutaredoxin-related protein